MEIVHANRLMQKALGRIVDPPPAGDLCTGGTATSNMSGTVGDLFDDNNATGAEGWAVPFWVKYDFGLGKAWPIVKYTLTAWATYGWGAWTFYGSNNDSDWTLLDTKTGQTYTWDEKKIYTFVNTTAYRYIKWDVTAKSNGTAKLREVEAMAYT